MVKRIAAVKTADSGDSEAITLQPTESREHWGSHAGGPWTQYNPLQLFLRLLDYCGRRVLSGIKDALEGLKKFASVFRIV